MNTAGTLRWELRRNCRLRPAQLAAWCAVPCAVSLLIGIVFALMGYPMFLAFAGLETVVVALAFVVYARHAADHATLTLREDGELEIAEVRGTSLQTTRLPTAWVTVKADERGLSLASRGTTVHLSGYATRTVCESLERDLRAALRTHRPLA